MKLQILLLFLYIHLGILQSLTVASSQPSLLTHNSSEQGSKCLTEDEVEKIVETVFMNKTEDIQNQLEMFLANFTNELRRTIETNGEDSEMPTQGTQILRCMVLPTLLAIYTILGNIITLFFTQSIAHLHVKMVVSVFLLEYARVLLGTKEDHVKVVSHQN